MTTTETENRRAIELQIKALKELMDKAKAFKAEQQSKN